MQTCKQETKLTVAALKMKFNDRQLIDLLTKKLPPSMILKKLKRNAQLNRFNCLNASVALI